MFDMRDLPSWRDSTDGGEYCGGEEDGLEVVPVLLVVLTDDVQAVGGGSLGGFLVCPEQEIKALKLKVRQIKLSTFLLTESFLISNKFRKALVTIENILETFEFTGKIS